MLELGLGQNFFGHVRVHIRGGERFLSAHGVANESRAAGGCRAPQHGLAEQHELLRRPQGKVLLNAIALTPSRPPHRRGSIQQ